MLAGEEELRAFLGIAPDHAGLRVIFDRRDKNMERNVYVLDDRVLIKTFTEHPGRRERRTLWSREHAALERLAGLSVPATYGCAEVRRKDGRTMYVLRKQYLHGSPITTPDARTIEEFAGLMAQFHARGVIAKDPARANLLRRDDGRLAVIDLGKAVRYNVKTPRFWAYLGKELAQVFSGFCLLDPQMLRAYYGHYIAAAAPKPWQRALMRWGFRRECRVRSMPAPELPLP